MIANGRQRHRTNLMTVLNTKPETKRHYAFGLALATKTINGKVKCENFRLFIRTEKVLKERILYKSMAFHLGAIFFRKPVYYFAIFMIVCCVTSLVKPLV